MFTIDHNFKSKFLINLANADYHGDKTAVSSSQLKRILKSPLAFKYGLTAEREETEAMRLGTLIHSALLEPESFRETYVVMPEFTGQTRDGKESKNSAEAKAKKEAWLSELSSQNKIACSSEEYEQALSVIKMVQSHDDAKVLLKGGIAESSLFFTHEETGILNKVRPDYLSPNYNALIDIKTTVSIDSDSFARTIWNYRYDFQMAMYRYGVSRVLNTPPKICVFIAVEKTPPFECAVYICDDFLLNKGFKDYNQAMRILAGCMAADQWEPSQLKMQTISLPNFVKE